jgi:phospholipid/cholesterol/gamma-HCH transport system substrate-binding protein
LRNSRTVGRFVAVTAVVVAVVAVAVLLLGGGHGYVVHARFQNASQLVKGDQVQVAGSKVGTVSAITLTDNGEADVALAITDGRYDPLHQGTQATVRQASLSGVANRYVDLRLPAAGTPELRDGAIIDEEHTTTAVDLDQLFNTFDPKTRDALRRLIRGEGTSYGGRGKAANAGWLYLDPSLAASSRLFSELNRDTPLLRDFVVNSSKLVTTVASRRDDLAGLVDHLATTTQAIGRQKAALSSAVAQFPGFMRRANTTFVNLRATIDDLNGLVNDSKPVAKELRPFVRDLKPLALDARPTLRDLSALIQRSGPQNDLVDLTRAGIGVRDVAVGPVTRNGKTRDGALPASTAALKTSVPELAYARPYAPDLVGWFDDFSHSGVYDALGGGSRASPHVSLPNYINTALPNGSLKDAVIPMLNGQAISVNQRNRCPGALERGTVWKPAPDYPCDASQVPIGK